MASWKIFIQPIILQKVSIHTSNTSKFKDIQEVNHQILWDFLEFIRDHLGVTKYIDSWDVLFPWKPYNKVWFVPLQYSKCSSIVPLLISVWSQ